LVIEARDSEEHVNNVINCPGAGEFFAFLLRKLAV